MKSVLTDFQKEILDILSQDKFITDNFYLSGGTALSEFYFHHRLSEYLDFFTANEIDYQLLTASLKPLFNKLKIDVIDYQQGIAAKIFFVKKRKSEKLKTDFNFWAFERTGKGKKYNNLEIDSLFDIAVNKIDTILSREKARDFIDLYFILKNTNEFDFLAVLKGLRKKYDWAADPIYLGTRLILIRELRDYPRMLVPLDKEDMIAYFVDLARSQKSKIIK